MEGISKLVQRGLFVGLILAVAAMLSLGQPSDIVRAGTGAAPNPLPRDGAVPLTGIDAGVVASGLRAPAGVGVMVGGCESAYTVTSVDDSGLGTLRNGIDMLCAGGTIDFALSYPATITLLSELEVTTSMTITGPGPENLALSGNNATGLFTIEAVSSLVEVNMAGLTLRDGYVDTVGGAIDLFNNALLRLENVDVVSNTAGTSGGGISVERARLEVTECRFADNTASEGDGGAIAGDDRSTVTVVDSTFTGNTALADGMDGGAIYNGLGLSSENVLNVSGSTFTDNRAYEGGAIRSRSLLHLSNSTFYHNVATDGDGGGSALRLQSTAYVTNTTIYSNTTTGSGGAVRITDDEGSYVFHNTLIASNVGNDCSLAGDAEIGGSNNLASDDTCPDTPYEAPPFYQVYPDFLLVGALGDYGGKTQTVPLLPGSMGIDFVDSEACPATDQRGIARPVASACDIGAFESRGFTITKDGGDGQSTPWLKAFTNPLSVTVSSLYGEPVDGGMVGYLAPRPTQASAYPVPNQPMPTLSAGKAALSFVANEFAGSYVITLTTTGVVTPVTYSLTNLQHATTVTVAMEDDSYAYMDVVYFTATVTDTDASTIPTGSVTFTVYRADGTTYDTLGPCALLTDGTSESELWQPPVGDYTIVAAYGGTDKYKASTSEATGFTVDPMPTRVTLSNPVMGSVYGTITTFVAEVKTDLPDMLMRMDPIVPTGVVTFTSGSEVLGTATLDPYGRAAFSTNTLPGGTHSITAAYGGDPNCRSSTSGALTYQVWKSDTKTSLYGAPATTTYGEPVTLIASVRGITTVGPLALTDMPAVPSGQVVFAIGEDDLGSASLDENGVARLVVYTLAAGSHEVVARFEGDDNYASSDSLEHTQFVGPTAATFNIETPQQPSASYVGGSATFTVTISGPELPAARLAGFAPSLAPATGTVKLSEGDELLGSLTLVDGSAVFVIDGFTRGTHTLTIEYEGDTNYLQGISDPLTHIVFERFFVPLVTLNWGATD